MTDQASSLHLRKRLIALSAAGIADFTIISLYQTGIIRRLPDLPGKIFDSNSVNKAPEAKIFGVPDGPVSLGVYALTITLAAAGGMKERRPRWLDFATAATVLGNAAGAAYYMGDMIFRQKKVCIYCVTGALINFASAAAAWKLLKR